MFVFMSYLSTTYLLTNCKYCISTTVNIYFDLTVGIKKKTLFFITFVYAIKKVDVFWYIYNVQRHSKKCRSFHEL